MDAAVEAFRIGEKYRRKFEAIGLDEASVEKGIEAYRREYLGAYHDPVEVVCLPKNPWMSSLIQDAHIDAAIDAGRRVPEFMD
jgi:hypothetical protein